MMNFTKLDAFGSASVGVFHRVMLFAIGSATVWAAGWTLLSMFDQTHASIQDLLLLFIYLEIGAMVGIYFGTNHMPVRFLIYIAITALVRHIVDLVSAHGDMWEIVATSGSTFVLAISLFLIRFGSNKFSTDNSMG
jgi:protein PsiE